MIQPLLIIFIINLGFLSNTVHSIRFDLQSGHTKCIAEDIKSNSMTVGKYSVVNPNEGHPLPDSHKLTVRVSSAYGNSYHHADHVESGEFAFTAAEAGDYTACFWAPDHKPQMTLTVDFDWKTGVSTKDWSNVAKKGQVDVTKLISKEKSQKMVSWPKMAWPDGVWEWRNWISRGFDAFGINGRRMSKRLDRLKVMELELKKLHDTVSSIHEEMFYLREREEEMQELNRNTNTRMAWLSFFSLFVCLLVAALQLWHLKTFFERKKLL